ncbi:altronate dehydratase [Sphingomonas piscis]|uniref:Altronate dehydratase n=1 Tax=Sphingomonas piscis TaxID=2714943 RepID=A0A6G7YTE9_9SPHN|nr:altronate dehydratase [Sphingomonas piscis]
MAEPRALKLHPDDDVLVLLSPLEQGDEVDGVRAAQAIPQGHKLAVRDIAAGDKVHKFGQVIGTATRPIARGEQVHDHNLTVGSFERVVDRVPPPNDLPSATGATFKGFVRADGRVGTRNFIGVLTSVNCSATVARRIADSFADQRFGSVDGVAAFTHSSGCGMSGTGEGIDTLERTLAGYATHPNFGGILLIGLGCEVAQIGTLLDRFGLAPGPRLRTMTIQEAGGTAKAIDRGRQLVRELIEEAQADTRVDVSASHLTLGLQCGGSDSWSGVTANPALGVAADLLIADGGTAILSETPEISGAENLLLRRAVSQDVAEKLLQRLAWWDDYAAKNGAQLNNNPSPGNKAGGLTTIYEKSLGAIAKAGRSPLVDVALYAERVRAKGLVFMDSPGFDPCSATGQIASGANILAFTTGRGSVFGSKPTPCIKLASNAALAANMDDDMDVDCSPILDGASIEEAGRQIYERLLDLASGQQSKSEALGFGDSEFVPWNIGAWM